MAARNAMAQTANKTTLAESRAVHTDEAKRPDGRDALGRFKPGNPNCWSAGQSGNPGGRRKGVSFAAALARQAVVPVADREEMANIARTIGLDPAEARNIDVVAALYYVALSRLLLRAATSSGRADQRIVGMLSVLLRALDPTELRLAGLDGGPIPIAAVGANVQAALGMHSNEAAPWIDHDGIELNPDDVGARLEDKAAEIEHYHVGGRTTARR